MEQYRPYSCTRTFTVDITQPTVAINFKPQDLSRGALRLSVPLTRHRSVISKLSIELWVRNDVRISPNGRLIDFHGSNPLKSNDTLAVWNTGRLDQRAPIGLNCPAWDTLGHESHDYVNVEVVKTSQARGCQKRLQSFAESGKSKSIYRPTPFQQILKSTSRIANYRKSLPSRMKAFPSPGWYLKSHQAAHICQNRAVYPLFIRFLISNTNNGQLTIYFSEDGKGAWQRLGGSINKKESKITTVIDQLGVFGLYKDMTAGNRSGIFQVSSQPRIFSPSGGGHDAKTAVSFELGKETAVTIKVYKEPADG
jgi:hypothetical protein